MSFLHLKFCCSLTSILLPEVVYEQSCLCLVIESVRGNYKQNCFFSIASFRISHFSVNLVLMKGLEEIFRKIQRCIFLQNCPDLVYRTAELRLNRIEQSDFPRRTVSQIGQPLNVCASWSNFAHVASQKSLFLQGPAVSCRFYNFVVIYVKPKFRS